MAGENEPVEAGQFLGNDGVFQENWRDIAFDEGDALRSNPTLAQIKDVRTLARQVVSGESTIGKLSGGREFTILPNEQSTDEERNEHYTKLGRPPKAEEYKLNDLALPEGLPKDEKLAEYMAGVLHKAGASTKLAVAVHNGYAEYIKSSLEAAATQDKIDDQEANKEIRGKFGAAYPEMMKDAAAAVEAFGRSISSTEADAMLKELPYDSFAAQMLAKIGKLIREHPLEGLPVLTDGTLTPGDAMTKINEIMRDPYYVTASPKDKPRNQAYHDELVEKVKKLFEIKTATV